MPVAIFWLPLPEASAETPMAMLRPSTPFARVESPIAMLDEKPVGVAEGSPVAEAANPIATLPPLIVEPSKKLLPLAFVNRPSATLPLALPLPFAAAPTAVFLLTPSPLALAETPQAMLRLLPAAVDPPPPAVSGGTVAPSALPTHTNCAAAGVGASAMPSARALAAQPPSRIRRSGDGPPGAAEQPCPITPPDRKIAMADLCLTLHAEAVR